MNKIFKITLVIFLLNIFFIKSVSAAYPLTDKKLLDYNKSKEILDDIKYLLSDKETIDYEDPKLNEILNKYDYNLFKTYKTFIEFDKTYTSKESSNEQIEEFLKNLVYEHIGYEIEEDIDESLRNKVYYSISIPLWLVLKYPQVLNYSYDRRSPSVNSNYSIKNLDAFEKFYIALLDAVDGFWNNCKGTLYLDNSASIRNYLDKISFSPGLLLAHHEDNLPLSNQEIEKSIKYLELWSYEGIWNRLKYKKIIQYLELAANELANYYSNNYGFEKFATYAKLILAQFVNHNVLGIALENDELPSEAFWYNDFKEYYILLKRIKIYENNLEKLKEFSTLLNNREKGYLLFYSILKEYDVDFIKWLIDSGANVNSMPTGETPLMASVRHPEITKLLLRSGADITIKNRFGKNVIFYAVQFGSKEIVEILLSKGGKNIINDKIYSYQRIEETYPEFSSLYLHPTMVVDFTPLIYAKRYATQEVVDLLVKHGATSGPADPEKIRQWVKQGPLDL